MAESSANNMTPADLKPRSEDRRRNLQLDGPPYETREGTVTVDRRSHIERRSCWIHDFEMSGDGGED